MMEILFNKIKNKPCEVDHNIKFGRIPNKQEKRALLLYKERMTKKLNTKMKEYGEKHNEILEQQGKAVYMKTNTHRTSKIPNYCFFDQWRYSNVKCKEHKGTLMNRDHLMEHLRSFHKKGREWRKNQHNQNTIVELIVNYSQKLQNYIKNFFYCSEIVQEVSQQKLLVFLTCGKYVFFNLLNGILLFYIIQLNVKKIKQFRRRNLFKLKHLLQRICINKIVSIVFQNLIISSHKIIRLRFIYHFWFGFLCKFVSL
ncbi:unnamed protein product [Paramecium sonneborni]|uniref:Uncharacterized protein n=1 Tax=Paramecium sonneborni TaxID=65129 RepID=A0A8S1RSP6_9CILI|nr:unnamed protein product [Paramecium sonneborni]